MIPGWLGAFAMGLAGSGHCGVMCGAIAGSAALVAPRRAVLGLAVHAGRLVAYGSAGAAVGGLGSLVGLGHGAVLEDVMGSLRGATGVVLVGLGLALALGLRSFSALERLGGPVWRLVRPFATRLAGPRTPLAALAFGVTWGFLPCGLVYAALGLATVSASPSTGAATMLAFGAGTLPALVAIGSFATALRRWLAHAGGRVAVGLLIAASGVVNVSASWPAVAGGLLAAKAAPACCRAHHAP